MTATSSARATRAPAIRAIATSLALVGVLGCGTGKDAPRSGSGSGPAPGRGPLASLSTNPPPATSKPEKITSPIRDNSVRARIDDGTSFEARLFVSKLTTSDRLGVALRFALDKPLEKTDWRRDATMDGGDFVKSLTFEIAGPDGKTTLQTEERLGDAPVAAAWLERELAVDGSGVEEWTKKAKWKEAAPALFSKPGAYTLTIRGKLELKDHPVEIALAPLPFEIVAPSSSFLSLADLNGVVGGLVKTREGLKDAPRDVHPVVEDADQNRSFRFQLESAADPWNARIVEVLVDPSGKELSYDAFVHFTCVARGARVATPDGARPIESLAPGDEVVAYDVERRSKTIAKVEAIVSSHAEHLVRIGELLVTGSHPVFDDGRFRLALDVTPTSRLLTESLREVSIEPVAVDLPTEVFDLSVSAPHTYFASGLLVHNKATAVPIGGQGEPFQGDFFRRSAKR